MLEGHFASTERLQVLICQAWCTVVEDQQWSQNTPFVGVDEDILVFAVVSDGNFRRDGSASTSGFEVANQVLSVLVNSVDITVDVNTVTRGPVVWFEDIQFIELLSNFDFADVFRDVNHLCCVLHQSTVLTFGGLVRAQAAPLCRVQITCFEVRLTSNKRRSNTAHVREGCKVGCSVEQLADTRSATDPVTSCKCVHDLGGQNIRAQAGGDFQLSLAVVVALKLVLQVTSKLSRGHTEQIFDEVTGEANTLVCIVVLVVWLTVGEGHFEDLANNAAKEDCLLLASARLVAQVRKEFTIEQLVDPLLSVFTLLTGCEFLL